MKIIVINGPNLNLLSQRDQTHYSVMSLEQILELMVNEFPSVKFELFQSNLEGEIVETIQKSINKFDGIIINPGGYAHTSVAIKDALDICNIPKVEVHLSHLANRDDFRQNLLTAKSTDGYISGFKENSYLAAAYLLTKLIK